MIVYTPEEKAFLREYIPGHHRYEIAEEFTRRFRPITKAQVKAFCVNNGLSTGFRGCEGMKSWNSGTHYDVGNDATKFKPGHMPHNWRPVGSERMDARDGYVMVKVAEPKTWVLKQRLVYEQTYGPIRKSDIVVFLDGNRLNFSPDNLACVSRRMHVRINQLGLKFHDRESFETACALVELKMKASEIRRGKGER